MIRAADLLVCKAGGLIVSEALAAGVPMLIAQAIPGQETGNAEVVVEEGAGAVVADGLEALVTVCHWLEHDGALLAERAVNARKLGRPDAAYQIADLAYQAALAGAQPREHRLPRILPQVRETLKLQPGSWSVERLLKVITDI
jgi:1,2-diacylglycerol 3-beta-galactosyltransferase